MINKIEIHNFKKFEKTEIDLTEQTILFVGQNNGGKTTALQALGLWSFLVQQWYIKKGQSRAKKRLGAPITRSELYIVPVRDLRSLWNECEVQDKSSKKIHIKITAHGTNNSDGKDWQYGMELTYGGSEFAFCRPASIDKTQPQEVAEIVYLPPLSGVQTSEKQLTVGAQLHAIGEGRPGEILRTMLFKLYSKSSDEWDDLQKAVRDFFALKLEPIVYNPETDPDIAIYYKPLKVQDSAARKFKLEIASAGSGFLQFLLLASFLYTRKNSVLLIDEPDSHMHIFLQRNMFQWLETLSRKNNCKLIISTHSEVLVNSAKLEQITTFFGTNPKKVNYKKTALLNALSKVSPLAVLNMEWQRRVVFVEGETDRRILREWATVLEHPVIKKLDEAYFEFYHTDSIKDALALFCTLKEIIPHSIKAFCLRDNVKNPSQGLPHNFEVYSWKSNEIENYLVHPDALIRFASKKAGGPLFEETLKNKAKQYIEDNLPPKVLKNPLQNPLPQKGSEFLDGFFTHVGFKLSKSDYYEVAQEMKREEVMPEVTELLDKLASFLS